MPKYDKDLQLPIDKEEYDKLVNQCLEIIKNPNNPILFVTDLVTFLPFSRATFYNYGLDKLDVLKQAIDDNKVLMKQALRSKWFNSNAPALQIALYKMIATPEERQAISNNAQNTQKDEDQFINNFEDALSLAAKEVWGEDEE